MSQAKLRYDPVELDPEDMCRMANEQPQVGSVCPFIYLLVMYRCIYIYCVSSLIVCLCMYMYVYIKQW